MKRNSTNDPKLSSLMHDTTALVTNIRTSQAQLASWVTNNATAFDDAGINPSLPTNIAEMQASQATQLENIINTFYAQICEEDLPE